MSGLRMSPGVGIDIAIEGQKTLRIESLGFAEAIWEIYFGKNNIGESIKRGLSSPLVSTGRSCERLRGDGKCPG
ncbi:MAG: hypothetical protein KatS3mg105_2988 [Gemmatales bacterium]|nr:MAG: hypothetical protein KatS3mg105_2988 [Gemmatales bacterium]